jgi:hypothetical protein
MIIIPTIVSFLIRHAKGLYRHLRFLFSDEDYPCKICKVFHVIVLDENPETLLFKVDSCRRGQQGSVIVSSRTYAHEGFSPASLNEITSQIPLDLLPKFFEGLVENVNIEPLDLFFEFLKNCERREVRQLFCLHQLKKIPANPRSITEAPLNQWYVEKNQKSPSVAA